MHTYTYLPIILCHIVHQTPLIAMLRCVLFWVAFTNAVYGGSSSITAAVSSVLEVCEAAKLQRFFKSQIQLNLKFSCLDPFLDL